MGRIRKTAFADNFTISTEMRTPAEIYEGIVRDLFTDGEVTEGFMMREPALKARNSVFCFYWADRETMGFKLGKGFDIEGEGVTEYEHLNPFKNKPPMYAWYMVPANQSDFWPVLAGIALQKMLEA